MGRTLTATRSTGSSETASSALTLLEAVDLAMVTLAAPLCRRLAARLLETSGLRLELSPSEPLLYVRLACPPDLPGPSTTWTGSSRRLECLEPSSLLFSSRNNLKIKDLFYDPEMQCLVLS